MAPATHLDELRDAARGETTLVGVGLTDSISMVDTIWATFVSEMAPQADLEYVQDVFAGRVQKRAAGDDPPDFMIVSNPASFEAAGLLDPFGTPTPQRYPAGWTDRLDRWLPVYVQPVVGIHNAIHLPTPPSSWQGFAESARDGRPVLEAPWRMLLTGPALAELKGTLGDDWRPYLESLSATDPLIVADNERAVLEVAAGSRTVGLANWNVARRVRSGSPLQHFFLDPTPCVPGFAVLCSRARNPNLARLFLAWLGSEAGQTAYATTGRIPAMPDVDSELSLQNVVPATASPAFGTVDWLSEPEPFAALFKELFPGEEPLPEGKVRSA